MNTINNIKFVNAWVDSVNRSAGIKTVAEKLDISSAAASRKAYVLRSKGVELPTMSRKQDENNVETLNAIIERKLKVQ